MAVSFTDCFDNGTHVRARAILASLMNMYLKAVAFQSYLQSVVEYKVAMENRSRNVNENLRLKKGMFTNSVSFTVQITTQRFHMELQFEDTWHLGPDVLNNFSSQGARCGCCWAWNAAAIAMAPLKPVPATRHTTVLKISGLAGVKYGPSSRSLVWASMLTTKLDDDLDIFSSFSRLGRSISAPGPAPSSISEASLFVH